MPYLSGCLPLFPVPVSGSVRGQHPASEMGQGANTMKKIHRRSWEREIISRFRIRIEDRAVHNDICVCQKWR